MKRFARSVLCACLGFAAGGFASGATLWVGPAGANVSGCGATSAAPCLTIQFAATRAATGDTVRVLPGSYNECVGFTSPVSGVAIVADAFETLNDRTVTVIDGTGVCDGTGPVPRLLPAITLGNNSSLRGFTVRGGGNAGVRGLGSVVITRNVITGNSAPNFGGGVYAYSTPVYTSTSTLRVEYNDIIANTAGFGGGGMFVAAYNYPPRQLRPVSVKGNVVRNNTTTDLSAVGAGIVARTTGAPNGVMSISVTQNLVEGNSNLGSSASFVCLGGGIHADASFFGTATIDVSGNTIRSNRSGGLGGGISVQTNDSPGGTATITLTGNTIENNESVLVEEGNSIDGVGGGIFVNTVGSGTESIQVTSNTIRSNSSFLSGGGVSAWAVPTAIGSQRITVASNEIRSNTGGNGGGVEAFLVGYALGTAGNSQVTVSDNDIVQNRATNDGGVGGGVFGNQESDMGASPGLRLRIHENRITGNTADVAGGGAYLWSLADGDFGGDGATVTTTSRIDFDHNLVMGNVATTPPPIPDGEFPIAEASGVLTLIQAKGPGTATVAFDANTIARNTADVGGGGIQFETFTEFDTNSVVEGQAVLLVTNSIITDNVGQGFGGPSPGDAGIVSEGGTGNLNVQTFAYNDLFANQGGNYSTWFGSRTGVDGNISADALLDANGKPVPCSAAVDRADPTVDYSLEPGPNGGRANLGHLGGTADATTSLADVNDDRLVDGVDILRIATSFASLSGDNRYVEAADLDGDGNVDGNDLAYVASQFGTKCP